MMVAISCGHDPRDVREWSEADLVHFSQHMRFTTQTPGGLQ